MSEQEENVACGSGVATSQTVASKIQSMCEEEEQMHLKVDYDLSMNSDHVSKCKIDVNIRPNGE